MGLSRRDGDILVWAPSLAGAPAGHAGIVVESFGKVNRLVHVGTADGPITSDNLGTLGYKPSWVFQCDDSALADMAAQVASAWSSYAEDSKPSYSLPAAIASAFTRSYFGPGARARAMEYRRYNKWNAKEGGRDIPPCFSTSGDGGTGSKLFCSMFVVAAYQGASIGDAEIQKYIALDAIHTSPMMLALYLKLNHHWKSCNFGSYEL